MEERIRILKKDLNNLKVPVFIFCIYLIIAKTLMKSLCPAVIITGFPCPGCGMTRAVFAILRGDFSAAWALHPFAFALYGFLILFGIWRYILMRDVKELNGILIGLVSALILFYIYRMVRYFPGEPPMSYYYDSILNKILNIF